MDRSVILDEVRQTIADVIDDANVGAISETTTAEDVEGWDSVQHVRILMALERNLKFRFSNDEIEKLKSVGDLVTVISRHTQSST